MGHLLAQPPFSLSQREKTAFLAPALRELTAYHCLHCRPYGQILKAIGCLSQDQPGRSSFLPVRLFKQLKLCSVPETELFKILTSSGTTSQVPSRIYLNRRTAQLQTRVLVKILQDFLGKTRLPMLIVDHPGIISKRSSFSARGAGILGMTTFGHSQTYLLNEDCQIDFAALEEFTEKFSDSPVLIFGFTFMVWQYLVRALEVAGRQIDLHQGVLVHSGGWKKLMDQAVDNATFKQRLRQATGIARVHNFYGMVEQVGSVFVECEAGRLHAPSCAEVAIRDPFDWRECSIGEEGLVEVRSLLPRSYPGHQLLTEDRGRLLGEDDCPCGRKGRTFQVYGRLPKAELRGCSDTHAEARQGGTI
ncbi:MAG: acyl-protein synthetase [Deltaproteobacteria bacterium]